MEEEIKLEGILNSPRYGQVGCKVRIIDGNAVSVFSNPRLGKELVDAEKKNGNKNIFFNERTGWVIENFPRLSKKEIATKLMNEMNLKPKDGNTTT